MKIAAMVALGVLVGAGSVSAGWLDEGTRSIRTEYVWDDDAGTEDAHGFEIGFGSALYELDDVSVLLTYLENSDVERQFLALSMEENWPIRALEAPLVPFVGVAAGYTWTDIDNSAVPGGGEDEEGGFTVRLELGVKYVFCQWFALSGSGRYSYCTSDIFPDDDLDVNHTNWDFAIGARFYY